MKNDLKMMKIIAGLLCCFVPRKKWRKAIRRVLVDDKRRRRELIGFGCKIEGDVLTTPGGIRVNISHLADYPLYMIKEVFFKSEYNLHIGKESILIDIGMNRGAVSLLFASYENIKKVYAYEPFGPTFESAQKNLRLNPRLSEKVHAFNVGLGRADAVLELPYLETATGAMSTTYDVCRPGRKTKTETVTVKDAAKELIPILEEHKHRGIIVKCDCEGAEFEIFERLKEGHVIGKIDVVMMEYHFEKPDKLVDSLVEKNFAVQVKAGSSKSKTGYIYAVRMANGSPNE
ncbi:MAG: FkbM family methyltransferase [Deltaproteobacteria bacterium]|nr:FkbM family methyltransferase [Deltaproteobacteria bacterium]